jgi:hypothetical protein
VWVTLDLGRVQYLDSSVRGDPVRTDSLLLPAVFVMSSQCKHDARGGPRPKEFYAFDPAPLPPALFVDA